MKGMSEAAIQESIRKVHSLIVALRSAEPRDDSTGDESSAPQRSADPPLGVSGQSVSGNQEFPNIAAVEEREERTSVQDRRRIALSALAQLSETLAAHPSSLVRPYVEPLLDEITSIVPLDPPFSDWLYRLQSAVESPGAIETKDEIESKANSEPGSDPASAYGTTDDLFPLTMDSRGESASAARDFALAEDPELLGDFIQETSEHLSSIESLTLVIERAPEDRESLNALFRSFHSIKGLAGFLELEAIREMAHQVETQLDRARNGDLRIGSNAIDCLLASTDFIRRGVDALSCQLRGTPAPLPPLDETLRDAIIRLSDADFTDESTTPPASGRCVAAGKGTSVRGGASSEHRNERANSVADAMHRQPAGVVKVETAKLDYLVDMVGEFVIAQSIVRHDPVLCLAEHPRLQRNLAQMARVTAEIQRTAMSMRMVPIQGLFQRMARLVRDLSRKTAKNIELVTSGEETELDRNLIEQLADPLMHMVRNSVDHGLETEEERAEAGKTPCGTVHLRASHESGGILIEVIDDGRGLNRKKILERAIERGILPAAANPPDAEVWGLVFEPGFSTAEAVTDLSGRGVGMDVVRRNIQQLRGRIDIESEAGRGTRISLRLPLTLAIIDGLLVGVGTERFVLPMYGVREMFRPIQGSVQRVTGGGELVDVRGHLLVIERLYRILGITPRTELVDDALLVVIESQSGTFCLMVDEFLGKQEVVIKPLGGAFRSAAAVSAGAILGDGKVALILDLDGLGGRARRSDVAESRSIEGMIPSHDNVFERSGTLEDTLA